MVVTAMRRSIATLTRSALPPNSIPGRRALCSGAARDGELEEAVRDVVLRGREP